MASFHNIKDKVSNDGFAVVEDVLTADAVDMLLLAISDVDTSKPTFRKTNDLFAIREFLREVPAAADVIFNRALNELITHIFGEGFFVVKSIYFDKPETSNWFVAYHQDLTISVDRKLGLDGYGPWTKKHSQFSVQPPLKILQDNFTVRIHLDDTTKENGALHVIPGSHLKGIYRPETIDWEVEKEVVCAVPKGGVMIMKPLLLHSSGRTTNHNKRRVIHIEFSRSLLPEGLQWVEFMEAENGC